MGSIARTVPVLCKPVLSTWNNDQTSGSNISNLRNSYPNFSDLSYSEVDCAIEDGITLNPFAETFVPKLLKKVNSQEPIFRCDKNINNVSYPGANTLSPQISNSNPCNPFSQDFSPRERYHCSMPSMSVNPCSSSYLCSTAFLCSNGQNDPGPDFSNSALFISNLSDNNDQKFCAEKGNFHNFTTNFSADPPPQNIFLPILNPLASQFIPQAPRPSSPQNSETENTLDVTPDIFDLETPDLSSVECQENKNRAELPVRLDQNKKSDEIDPNADHFVPILVDFDITDSTGGNVSIGRYG